MKLSTSFVWGIIMSLVITGACHAGNISLPWSNRLNCSPWTYNGSSESITSAGCTEFTVASDYSACGTYAQVSAAANNSDNGSGGVGIRQYVGSGVTSTNQTEATNGFSVTLPDPTSVNIRWYERYQAGFRWSDVGHHKDVYVSTAVGNYVIPTPMYNGNTYVVATYSGGQNNNLSGSVSNFINPGDGKWHLYELHATKSGSIQMWVDEVLIISATVPAFDSGFRNVQFGSNITTAANSPCAAIDYDDLAITAGTYIGPVSGGGGGGGGGGTSDTTRPTVTAFGMPATSTSRTVPVSAFRATDNVAVTGYCITGANNSSSCTWSGSAPGSYTFPATGAQTAYAWAKDAAGNASTPLTASVNVSSSGSTTAPVISNVSPTGTQACSSNPRSITMSVQTDKAATCKLNATDASYSSMKYTFPTTGGTTHSVPLSLSCGTTYSYYVRCADASGNASASSTTVAIPVASTGTVSTTPPVISNVSPTGTQACSSNPRNITMSIQTDKAATCKLNATDASYSSMKYTFPTTGGTTHSVPLSLSCGVNYTYYARCTDAAGHAGTTSTVITIPVAR
ncbi:MAG TPA: hypothetical protein VGJ94_02280 [Syntrophorhabdaceae bacterium]